jgi:hypothetical protein
MAVESNACGEPDQFERPWFDADELRARTADVHRKISQLGQERARLAAGA